MSLIEAINNNNNRWISKKVLGVIFVLSLGQLVSLNLAVTGFTSSLLANLRVNAPLTQSLFTYSSLALVYTPIFLYRRQRLLVPWYWYLLWAIIDVHGNFFVTKAYQFSSITSVAILDCWTTPWVIILTWVFLGTRYSLCQFFGAGVCVFGLCLVLLSDSGVSGSGGSNPLLGDALVIAGTLCYAISNVAEEFCVKKKDLVEVLSMLGIFGLLVTTCQIFVFERNNLEAIKWSPEIIALFGGFGLSSFMFASIVPYVLKFGGSALFNLSLLTSDMWAVLIRLFIYHQEINKLYYLSCVVVALGLIIYSVTDKNSINTHDVQNEDVSNPYHVLEEEEEARNKHVVST